MSDEKLNLHDLFAESPSSEQAGLSATDGGQSAVSEATDNVLHADRWAKRRGAQLRDEWIGQGVSEHDITEQDEVIVDAHTMLFEPEPVRNENPKEKQRAAWWDQFMESQEYRTLHNETMLNPFLSALAAKSICDSWQKYANEQKPEEPQDGDPAPGSDDESLDQTLARMKSTSEALEQAQEQVDDANDMQAGLGMGNGGDVDQSQLAEYFRKIRHNRLLSEIMKMAGRMRSLCQSLQQAKVTHGRDDVVGVEFAGDLNRLLPSEKMKLCCGIEELELLTLSRLARKRCLCRKYSGVEKVGRGPIVVHLDESRSMGGTPLIAGKAICLTMAWLAQKQNRWCAFVSFSSGGGEHVILPPNHKKQDELLEWLCHNYAGGTTLQQPLGNTPKVLWPEFVKQGLQRGKTDHIIITDACVHADEQLQSDYRKWASEEDVTTLSICIGTNSPGSLQHVSDRWWCIPSLDLNEQAIGEVLSI